MPQNEKRKYDRYDTEADIYFRVNFDIRTKVKYLLLDKSSVKYAKRKYFALSRNISAEGLSFCSDKKLKKGDNLYLEVYVPKQKNPVCMTGEVRWSKHAWGTKNDKYKYNTGIKLMTVYGKQIKDSICYDKKHHIVWSAALDSVFGSFRKIMREKDNKQP